MNKLESMAVFLDVVEAGSLSAAGRRLGIPLATVSRRISDLETALGTRLLTHSTRQLGLTESGRAYVAACRRILEDVHEAERMAAGEYSTPRGELVVTAPVVFGRLHVLPTVVDFLAVYPDVTIRLSLGDRYVNLLEDHVDLAVRVGALPDSGLVAANLGSVRRVVCASPAYLDRHGVPREPRELSLHQCVSMELLATGDTWHFNAEGSNLAVPVQPRLAVSTAEAAIDAAVAGMGVTCVLSYQVESAVRAGRLKLILEAFAPAPLPVSFLYARQGLLPLKLRALLDFATPRLRERLQKARATLRTAT